MTAQLHRCYRCKRVERVEGGNRPARRSHAAMEGRGMSNAPHSFRGHLDRVRQMTDSRHTPRRYVAILVLALVGCYQPAEQSQQVNQNFTVERLFEHDGCTAYRFRDDHYVYYIRCHDGRVSAQSRYWVSTWKAGYYVDVHTSTESQ